MTDIGIEDLIARTGGPFHLVTLFQKRMRELQHGRPPLVEPQGRSMQDIVSWEILQDKIWLATTDEEKALLAERSVEALEDGRTGEAEK